MIIGFTGYAGSGKTTAAWHLVLLRGFLRVSFAFPIREMLLAYLGACGMSPNQAVKIVNDQDLKELPIEQFRGKSFRHAAQTLGTEWGRSCIGEDIWVWAAMASLDTRLHSYVFDDVRFPNEVDAIHERGGLVYRIDRPGVGPVNEHASDNQELDVDGVILNHGDKVLLGDLVDAALLDIGR